MKQTKTGAEILLESLIAEGVDTIFGYPGGTIISVYDKLTNYSDKLKHVLVRHEQGAIHAAQGYARVTGRPGVVMVTSGPGVTNVITGVADAMGDSTPVIVIAGQVSTATLGTDAFQETDLIGLSAPVDKWTYQIRRAEDVSEAVSKAFYIASTGRPGPVVLDFTKTAQVGTAEFEHKKCTKIRSYIPSPKIDDDAVDQAAYLINNAKKPFVVYGHGVLISKAEKELASLLDKADIPAASTMLGLSALPSDNSHFVGMAGMHGSIAANMLTQQCDVLIAIGMRFDDRVTGKVDEYAPNAKVVHIDIDDSEINKIIRATAGVLGDAKQVLTKLLPKVKKTTHKSWNSLISKYDSVEQKKVIEPETAPKKGHLHMGEVIDMVANVSKEQAIVVTDVGQNQLMASRYSRFRNPDSFISSGGLGTMGFGLPAAIGAKTGCPGKQVCAFIGDGGLQMTIQEFGTIMQEGTAVKIVLLNNNWLGNVRQWQELFFKENYSQTRMLNPDYSKIAAAYGIEYRLLENRKDLKAAVTEMLKSPRPFLLEARVEEMGMVYPMVPAGRSMSHIMLNTKESIDLK